MKYASILILKICFFNWLFIILPSWSALACWIKLARKIWNVASSNDTLAYNATRVSKYCVHIWTLLEIAVTCKFLNCIFAILGWRINMMLFHERIVGLLCLFVQISRMISVTCTIAICIIQQTTTETNSCYIGIAIITCCLLWNICRTNFNGIVFQLVLLVSCFQIAKSNGAAHTNTR